MRIYSHDYHYLESFTPHLTHTMLIIFFLL